MNEWEIKKERPSPPKSFVPLSYSALKLFDQCPLRFFFERDDRYPPKSGPIARMGTAFHATLAAISSNQVTTLGETMEFFSIALREQRALVKKISVSNDYHGPRI